MAPLCFYFLQSTRASTTCWRRSSRTTTSTTCSSTPSTASTAPSPSRRKVRGEQGHVPGSRPQVNLLNLPRYAIMFLRGGVMECFFLPSNSGRKKLGEKTKKLISIEAAWPEMLWCCLQCGVWGVALEKKGAWRKQGRLSGSRLHGQPCSGVAYSVVCVWGGSPSAWPNQAQHRLTPVTNKDACQRQIRTALPALVLSGVGGGGGGVGPLWEKRLCGTRMLIRVEATQPSKFICGCRHVCEG